MAELRCHSCSHFVGESPTLAKLVMVFDPRAIGRIPRTHEREIRRRCRACGWINLFHPATASEPATVVAVGPLAGAGIELKAVTR